MTINYRNLSFVVFTINIVGAVPPVVERLIPGIIEFHEGSIFRIVMFIVSSVHEEIKFITTVEVTASFTWAKYSNFNNITDTI